MSNVINFPASRRTLLPSIIAQSDRDFINACIDRKLAERTALSPHRKRSCTAHNEWHRAFGRALREVRIKAGVSIEDAAAAAERTVETWQNYETTGKGRLTYPLLLFATRYGISLDAIFDMAKAALDGQREPAQ